MFDTIDECQTIFVVVSNYILLNSMIFNTAFSTYACVIADPMTSDVSQFCTITLPSYANQYLEQIIGKERVEQLSKFMDHGFQIIYLIIVLGCWSIVFNYGYPEIAKSNYVSSYHQRIGYVVFIMCMGSWHYACTTSPGRITAATIALFDHYDYDDVLYTNRQCPTIQIRKIARSKYDRSTQTHVPRFDHHCVWLNNAMGERNYRYFLLFLSIHVCMCLYGTWVVGAVMYGEVLDKDLLNAIFYNAATGEEVQADYFVVFHYLFIRHFELCCVLLLMSVMVLMLGLFLGFHLYITSINMTTNEYFKWRSVKRWHNKERLKYETALKVGLIATTECNSELLSQQQVPEGDIGCVGATAVEPPIIADDAIFDPGECKC